MALNFCFLCSQGYHEWKHCTQRKKSVTGQYPPGTRNRFDSRLYRAGGFRFSAPEYLQSLSAPGLTPECCTMNTEILAKKLALRLWVCTVMRACFICNRWPNSIFQSLEILQNRNKHDALGVWFIACSLLQNKVCLAWSGSMWPAHHNVWSLATVPHPHLHTCMAN